MIQKQISVFLENKPGKLSKFVSLLAENQIDLSALSIAETQDYGILRIIVDQPDKAVELLRERDYIVKQTDVIAAVMDDRPGGLSAVLRILAGAGVSVEYMYAFVGNRQGHAVVVMRTDAPDKAQQALEENHVTTLEPKDVYRL